MSVDVPEYSFEQKERLARRIQKLRKHKYLNDIQNIITKYNQDLDITSNPSGKFMYFQNLKKETYYVLDKYVQKILRLKALSETNDAAQYSSEITRYSEDDVFVNDPAVRYSNTERNIIKRKIYDRQIIDQQLESATENLDQLKLSDEQSKSENNVFVRRKSRQPTQPINDC